VAGGSGRIDGSDGMRLETHGAAIVRGFLNDQDFSRIAEMAGNAFAFLEGGGGDTFGYRSGRSG